MLTEADEILVDPALGPAERKARALQAVYAQALARNGPQIVAIYERAAVTAGATQADIDLIYQQGIIAAQRGASAR